MDLRQFADSVGETGPVAISGLGTRGGDAASVRTVSAPAGVRSIQPAELTVRCGAGTPLTELVDALASYGQSVALPASGTVGGALAVGESGIRRLGEGPIRDAVLQVKFVNWRGEIVKAGGPTVKNVSGFDVCRLLVGSRGTLGFLGEVILRTKPKPNFEQWFVTAADPFELFPRLYRPTSVLWDGSSTWVLLTGHPRDVEAQAKMNGLHVSEGPAELPTGGRSSMPPSMLGSLVGTGSFVAEIGVGVVHHQYPAPPKSVAPAIIALHQRLKHEFDPVGRLNAGVDVLAARTSPRSSATVAPESSNSDEARRSR